MTDKILDLNVCCEKCGEETILYVDYKDYLYFLNCDTAETKDVFPYLTKEQISLINDGVCPRCAKKLPKTEMKMENALPKEEVPVEWIESLLKDMMTKESSAEPPKEVLGWY